MFAAIGLETFVIVRAGLRLDGAFTMFQSQAAVEVSKGGARQKRKAVEGAGGQRPVKKTVVVT